MVTRGAGAAWRGRDGAARDAASLKLLSLAGFAMSYGVDRTPSLVGVVSPGSAAAKAGARSPK